MKLSKQRLEAFSDGVIAIIITIIVLNTPLPDTLDLRGVLKLLQTLAVYFVSFVVVGSFWNRHNRIFSYIDVVTNQVIWINLLFLFFLSLLPILTKWVMENPGNIVPVICYDVVYLFINLSYVFIFHFVINNSDHEEIKSLMAERGKQEQKQQQRFFHIRFLTAALVVAGAVALSIYKPRFCAFLLLGLPVIWSAVDLVFDDGYRQKRHELQHRQT